MFLAKRHYQNITLVLLIIIPSITLANFITLQCPSEPTQLKESLLTEDATVAGIFTEQYTFSNSQIIANDDGTLAHFVCHYDADFDYPFSVTGNYANKAYQDCAYSLQEANDSYCLSQNNDINDCVLICKNKIPFTLSYHQPTADTLFQESGILAQPPLTPDQILGDFQTPTYTVPEVMNGSLVELDIIDDRLDGFSLFNPPILPNFKNITAPQQSSLIHFQEFYNDIERSSLHRSQVMEFLDALNMTLTNNFTVRLSIKHSQIDAQNASITLKILFGDDDFGMAALIISNYSDNYFIDDRFKRAVDAINHKTLFNRLCESIQSHMTQDVGRKASQKATNAAQNTIDEDPLDEPQRSQADSGMEGKSDEQGTRKIKREAAIAARKAGQILTAEQQRILRTYDAGYARTSAKLRVAIATRKAKQTLTAEQQKLLRTYDAKKARASAKLRVAIAARKAEQTLTAEQQRILRTHDAGNARTHAKLRVAIATRKAGQTLAAEQQRILRTHDAGNARTSAKLRVAIATRKAGQTLAAEQQKLLRTYDAKKARTSAKRAAAIAARKAGQTLAAEQQRILRTYDAGCARTSAKRTAARETAQLAKQAQHQTFLAQSTLNVGSQLDEPQRSQADAGMEGKNDEQGTRSAKKRRVN